MMKLGFLGIGFMANAIINGILTHGIVRPEEICIFDIDDAKLKPLADKGLTTFSSAQNLLNHSDCVIIAVKPQNANEIFSLDFSSVKAVFSIMAGVKISSIRNAIGDFPAIVRVMPNMPCSIGKGFSAIAFNNASDSVRKFAFDIFSACGEAAEIDEKLFDAVTSVSGSGPAYVYMFISGMIKGGVLGGLSTQDARKMAIATVIGAAETVKQSNDESIDIMIDKVCSKGGTTIEAINHFKESGLEEIIAEGVAKARKRSVELSKI